MQSILMIDDQQDLLDVTRLYLERRKEMTVETVTSAKDALELTTRNVYDAIIADFDMPEINGIEFLRILRARGDTTPVIIFTGVGKENTAIEALNSGADFYLRKGEDPHAQFVSMVELINKAVKGRFTDRTTRNAQKLLGDTIAFFPEASFALDHEGKVLAWNKAMVDLTGVRPAEILGKGNSAHAIPFFGRRSPMLSDLVFEDETSIRKSGYTIVSKMKGSIIAWTKIGNERVLWMKAAALYDTRDLLIGVISSVRDVTDELGNELLLQSAIGFFDDQPSETPAKGFGLGLDRLLGKAGSQYREGLRLSYREGKYADALPFFDRALEIDPGMAAAWHDRGVALRKLGRDEEALKDLEKAAELAPEDEEFLFTCADQLRKLGILQGDKNLIEGAVTAFNRVLELNPNQADACDGLGSCMKELGKSALARQYFDKVQELKRMGKSVIRRRNLDTLV
jgi:CheY-like chemotaxis protein